MHNINGSFSFEVNPQKEARSKGSVDGSWMWSLLRCLSGCATSAPVEFKVMVSGGGRFKSNGQSSVGWLVGWVSIRVSHSFIVTQTQSFHEWVQLLLLLLGGGGVWWRGGGVTGSFVYCGPFTIRSFILISLRWFIEFLLFSTNTLWMNGSDY